MAKHELFKQDWVYFRPKKETLRLPKVPEEFLAQLGAIFDEIGKVVAIVKKHGGQITTKNCLPNNYARRLIFSLVQHAEKLEGSKKPFKNESLKIFKNQHGYASPKTQKAQKNIFFLCYSCAFDSATIGKAERSRAPSLLFQAYKLKVPEKHLVGFILQHSIPKKDEFQFVYNRSPQKAK